ncbi:gliding motility lipoprotein GldH [Chryseobacterium sp. T1]
MMRKILGLFSVLWLLVSCSNPNEKVYMTAVGEAWSKKDSQKIDIDITDSQNAKNIIFVIRNNNEYPYSNLRLISSVQDNQQKVMSKDTLNYILAKPNGEWLGSGFGDTKEILVQYKLNYKFPKNGKYTIDVIQAMRKDKLNGIEDIGVKIENVKP